MCYGGINIHDICKAIEQFFIIKEFHLTNLQVHIHIMHCIIASSINPFSGQIIIGL